MGAEYGGYGDILIRSIIVSLLLCLAPTTASAQDTKTLQAALTTYSFAAALDTSLTYGFLQQHRAVEGNPLLRGFHNDPVATTTALAVGSILEGLVWKRVAKRHPKVALVGLYTESAFRCYYSYKSIHILKGDYYER